MQELAAVAQRLGVRVVASRWLRYAQHQAVFYGSHFDLLGKKWPAQPHRLGLAYFHGRPGTASIPEFDTIYQRLCQTHHQIERIQASHSEMREVILNSGIAPEKVFLIPIGINLAYFTLQTIQTRQKARERYGLPTSAVIVGSFQKDGNGWGEGLEPKHIKGPDVFLKTIEILQSRVPELFVLLSGPARGYVKAGLERLGVPYRHYYLSDYPEIGQLFQTLDVYIIPSRQEGGPKAVLEAMASGVPLVTTRVGQAMDLVQHDQNGWLVEIEDAEGLAHWAEYVLTHRNELGSILRHGRQTAEANTYEAQIPLWQGFMQGFVQMRNN
jgi:glycosyltransferase involved in cell wall biosynthesis